MESVLLGGALSAGDPHHLNNAQLDPKPLALFLQEFSNLHLGIKDKVLLQQIRNAGGVHSDNMLRNLRGNKRW